MDFWNWFWLLMIYIPLFLVWGIAIFDVFRRDDLSGGSKALWFAAILVFPIVGTLVYLVARPSAATHEERVAVDQASRVPAPRPTPESTAHELEVLAGLHDRGKLTDEEFAAEKARLIGTGAEPRGAHAVPSQGAQRTGT